MNGEAGKGDTPRPKSISDKEFTHNFETVFGKKKNWWQKRNHQKWVKEAKQIKNKDNANV